MAKKLLYVLGIVFIILGLIGFFSGGELFGIFHVDAVHNLVHLVSGILALYFASRGEAASRSFALVLGIVYGLVTILGFLTSGDKILGIMAIDTADNYLHLVLAIVLIAAGLKKSGSSSSM